MIYLDNAATTMTFSQTTLIADWAFENYGNPSSIHGAGTVVAKKIEEARNQIAECIGALPEEIIFTSGGSESNNLALRGIAPYLKEIGKTTIITSAIEHHSVLKTCQWLEKNGFKVIYMPVDVDGRVDIEELEKVMESVTDELGLVSIMTVNNEVGSIQLIDDIGDLCNEYNVLFMTDAVQALCHVPLNVNDSHIDLMSMSGHKIHAIKGTGALYVRKGTKLDSLIMGGGQEFNLRAGTENVPGILSMGKAVEIIGCNIESHNQYYKYLRKTLFDRLDSHGVKYSVNCDGGVPNIISLNIPNCESQAMVLLLSERKIYVSAGSACDAGSLEPSHVLKALYLSDGDASCTIRISLGIFNNSIEMNRVGDAIHECSEQLLSMM